MALLPATLIQETLKLTDKDSPSFVGFPETFDEAAENWSGVMRAYFEQASSPSIAQLAPGTHDAAEQATIAVMAPGFAARTPTALQDGFVAYAAAMAAGLLPAFGVAVPPVGLVIPLLPLDPPPTAADAASTMATAVQAWAITGTVTPPAGSPVPWV